MTPTKNCRVCGKAYTPCFNTGPRSGVFRWRDVSCSPECGEIYLQRILESRNPAPKKTTKQKSKKTKAKLAQELDLEFATAEVENVANSEADANTLDSNRD